MGEFKPFSHQGVEVRGETLTLPTYDLGPPDPNPPILGRGIRSIYPYPWQKSFTTRITPRRYDAIVLTSRRMTVVVLPDWGMHVYRLVDRRTGRDLFHVPEVMKPAHNALRGAFIAGGVEMNFPVGHSVVTCSRVGVFLRKAPRGVQLLFQHTDRRSGLSCAAGFTLRRDFRGVVFDQYLHNPTDLPQPWYYWLNAGLAPHRSLRFLFPTDRMIGHFEGPFLETASPYGFPIHEGADYSRYDGIPEPMGLFSPCHQAGWFGAWYDDWNFGVVRWAPPWQVAGQKCWAWGMSEEGRLWGAIGGDRELSIPEIQSGRPETQMDRGVLLPSATVSHHEWWMPISDIGDVQAASPAGAMAVRAEGDAVRVAVSPASSLARCSVRINGCLAGRPFDLAAGVPYVARFSRLSEGVREVAITGPNGTVLRWDSRPPIAAANVETLCDRLENANEMGPETLVLRGRKCQRTCRPDLAQEFYQRALTKEPANSSAHLELGLLSLQAGRNEEAEGHLSKALAANRWSDESLYLHGLACLRSGRCEQARADFHRAAATGTEYAVPSLVQAAMDALRLGDTLRAEMIVADGLERDPANATLLLLRTVVRRRTGGKKSRASDCDSLDRVLGVSLLARWERRFAGASDPWTYIPSDAESEDGALIEAALAYARCGERDKAVQLLRKTASGSGRTRSRYLLAWLGCHFTGARGFERFFGWGWEDRLALESAVARRPRDATARFALGCLKAEEGNLVSAAEHLRRAGEICRNDSVIAVARGVVLSALGRTAEAIRCLRRALTGRPVNPAAWVQLDRALGMAGRRGAAWLRTFSAAPPAVLENEEAREALARLACDLGRYDQAAGLLATRQFHPYELTHHLRDLWSEIHRRKAVQLALKGRFEAARRSILIALEYPPNLALGRPVRRFDAPTLYAAGCIAEAEGDRAGAACYFAQAAEEDQPGPTPAKPWSVLAQIKLGQKKEASRRLRELREQTRLRLDSGLHPELRPAFEEILALCERIEKGWTPNLQDIARVAKKRA